MAQLWQSPQPPCCGALAGAWVAVGTLPLSQPSQPGLCPYFPVSPSSPGRPVGASCLLALTAGGHRILASRFPLSQLPRGALGKPGIPSLEPAKQGPGVPDVCLCAKGQSHRWGWDRRETGQEGERHLCGCHTPGCECEQGTHRPTTLLSLSLALFLIVSVSSHHSWNM